MKNLTLILLLLTATLSNGQGVWAPPGATWYYSYDNFAATGYVRVKYVGDSVVGGQNCKVLEKKIYWHDFIFSTTDSAVIDTAFTYLQNDSVFYYLNNQFFLLYDFNGQPSDIWQVAETDTMCTDDSLATVQVDSIGISIINATTLKWVSVTPTPNSHYGYYGQIIERIGCHDFYMFPEYVACIADANEGGPFRCYYDSTFGLYQKGTAPYCDFILGIETVTKDDQEISIYPNPTTTEITVSIITHSTDTYDIVLYSALGQKLNTIRTNKNKTTIDTSNFPEGVYYITVTDGRHKRWAKKIIKTQHNNG